MTRDETAKILLIINTAFPNFKVADKTATVDAWHFFLVDYEYNDIAIALKTFVATSGSAYAPSASQLIAMTHKADEYTQLNEAEAWALVNNALRNSSYHAEEEFNKLPDLVKKCVGTAEQLHSWASTSESALDTVIASNFMKTYEKMANRELELKRMPVEARQRLGGIYEQARLNG